MSDTIKPTLPPDYYAGVIRQLEARVAVLDTACDELQMQLSSAQIYAESVEELYAEQLEAAKAGQGEWEPIKFGTTHVLNKPGGDLRGYLTLTPVRLCWMSALDDYTEIIWGTDFRVYRRVATGDGAGKAVRDAS